MHQAELMARVIDAYLGNPFTVAAEARAQAGAAAAALDVAAAVRQLLDRGARDRAELLILAVGHHRACQHAGNSETVYPDSVLPRALAGKLPRPVGDYLRIVAAAGRCHRALSAIRGSSALLQGARRDTWAACFGDSLRHALELEPVIRDHDVLILGETGTGKEAFARAIQAAAPGGRDGRPAPSAALNAAALPETLVESELFGHVKGAFTGASDSRVGRLRSAAGGCFFLDEVGDLPTTTQVKLLRVIETNEVVPLGADSAEHVELRYVAATHRDLDELVRRGEFRQDLFQRLAGNVIRIAPLRERPEDIVDIGLGFVDGYGQGGDPDGRIRAWLSSVDAREYAWPGNVRELQNALRNLLLGLPPGVPGVDVSAQPGEGAPGEPGERRQRGEVMPAAIAGCTASLQAVSDWYMRRVLAHVDGNYSQAAKILAVDRSTVRRRAEATVRRRAEATVRRRADARKPGRRR